MYGNAFERLRAITRWSGGDEVGLAVEAAGTLGQMGDAAGLVVACRRMLAHHPANAPLWWACAHLLAAADPRAAARDVAQRLDADRTGARLASSLPIQRDDGLAATVGWPRAVDAALAERADVDVVAVRTDDIAPKLRERSGDRRVRLVHGYELATLPVTLVLVEAIAVGPDRALVDPVTVDVLGELPARADVWLVAGVGRVLPNRLLDAVVAACRATDDPRLTLDADGDAPAPAVVRVDRFDRIAGPRGVEATTDGARRADCPVPPELLRPLDR